MPSAKDLEVKVAVQPIAFPNTAEETARFVAIQNAALKAENAQQKQRIDFLERTVTQMIHTQYNAQVVPPSGGPAPLQPSAFSHQPSSPVPRGTSAFD